MSSEEPQLNFGLVRELQEYLLEGCNYNNDYSMLHLGAAMAGMCNSITEAQAIAGFTYRLMRQKDVMTDDNVLEFKR